MLYILEYDNCKFSYNYKKKPKFSRYIQNLVIDILLKQNRTDVHCDWCQQRIIREFHHEKNKNEL